ncbi:MAG: hypothetical protein DRR19_20945 [Candidatus Parabeggiatoa sp. nov. 1]|nr:MAG: hypothetical protein DRR19_20945 [Gammaproteobacteria bacterium]
MMNLKASGQVPKAQQEVSELKQRLYEEIKDMSTADSLKYLLEKNQKTVEHIRHNGQTGQTLKQV